ncbi:hypothetical protein GCM10022221_64830 [Actinocorallia aurea]
MHSVVGDLSVRVVLLVPWPGSPWCISVTPERLDAMIEWYSDKLGFVLERRFEAHGTTFVFIANGDVKIELLSGASRTRSALPDDVLASMDPARGGVTGHREDHRTEPERTRPHGFRPSAPERGPSRRTAVGAPSPRRSLPGQDAPGAPLRGPSRCSRRSRSVAASAGDEVEAG